MEIRRFVCFIGQGSFFCVTLTKDKTNDLYTICLKKVTLLARLPEGDLISRKWLTGLYIFLWEHTEIDIFSYIKCCKGIKLWKLCNKLVPDSILHYWTIDLWSTCPDPNHFTDTQINLFGCMSLGIYMILLKFICNSWYSN